MALKTVIETTEGLDEAVKALYTEADGKFILQVEDVDAHPDVANLKSAYERVKADLQTAKLDRDKFKLAADGLPEDFDPQKWEKLKDGKADEAAKLALRQEFEAKIEELEGKLTATQETARKTAIERDLTDALTSAGFTDPAIVDLARTKLAGEVQVGDDGKVFIDSDMGPISPVERAKRLASGEWKGLVTAPKGGGSKSGEGSGKPNNPLMDKVPGFADLPEK